jgi:signal transduction histidine kinase
MKQVRVETLLIASMLVMTVLPMATALYFVNNVVATSLSLGFNSEVTDTLETNAQHLKQLAKLDPEHQAEYRAEFDKLVNLKSIYGDKQLLEQSIRHSLLIYFALGVAVAVLTAIAVATVVGRRISTSYQQAFAELTQQRDRNRYLEAIGSWQELAKMLAHEIRNPLTPIRVSVTSLARAYREQDADTFSQVLKRTEDMVSEELGQLTKLVDRFSDLAKLPQVELQQADLIDTLINQVTTLNSFVKDAELTLVNADAPQSLQVMIDVTLFRQVLTNIVRNGIEANPGRRVAFTIEVTSTESSVKLSISNNGHPVPTDIVPRLFDPYVTSRSGANNMGLGLAIVRKVILEHGGEAKYHEQHGQPVFTLSLPRIT